MGNRIYNILFHLHTVSSIVISVALYVIFFGGSFAFFRDEIVNWERNQSDDHPHEIIMDINQLIDSLAVTYDLYGREISISKSRSEPGVTISLSASADTLASGEAKQGAFFYLDNTSFSRETYAESYTLGEFLYRLHFFAQIPYPIGYYLSGFVAFFFLFAIITGVLVHWDKIIKNFYLFRPWAKLKTMWTDAHTALGMIGLPFQFIYAVTGAFFMLNTVLVAPVLFALYDGDQAALYDDLEFNHPTFELSHIPTDEEVDFNAYVTTAKQRWEGLSVSHIIIHNYGDSLMHVTVEGRPDHAQSFTGLGELSFHALSGEVVHEKDYITESSYLNTAKLLMYQLHFADYGKRGLRVISFIWGLISCFVIISGVMIWLTARDKKSVSEKKRKFYSRVGWIYLAICLSMYPITALAFVVVKLVSPMGMTNIYAFYFVGWLLLSVFFTLKKDNYFTNKYTLLSGGLIGLLVPVTNGLATGNWFWMTATNGLTDLFLVDALWLVLSAVTLIVGLRLKRSAASPSVLTL